MIDKINVPKLIKIGGPFNIDFSIKLENNSKIAKPSNGIINYIMSDRNENVIMHGSVNGSNNSTILTSSNGHTNFQNTMNKNVNQISLQIGPDKTKLLSPGPAKLKLFITSMDSMRPIIYEYTLIARP